MFSKSSKSEKTNGGKSGDPSLSLKPAVPSIISADLTINGDLHSDGEIQVDGTINGDIHTTTLLVGETAHVRGEIQAKRVRVHGRVDGQIVAQSVVLASTAHVVGDVVNDELAIEKGAFLEGHCKRLSEAAGGKPTASAEPESQTKDDAGDRGAGVGRVSRLSEGGTRGATASSRGAAADGNVTALPGSNSS